MSHLETDRPGTHAGWGLWLALAAGLALKGALIASGSVGFNSDEAIIGLMARHILQGQHPAFFYGQAYMGALDAYLVAGAFAVFGQTVTAIRLVQAALFAGVIVTTGVLARRLSVSSTAAWMAALLVAVPPVMVSLYTTASLGDYGETLLINNLLLLLGWDLLSGRKQSAGWWLAWGLLAGLGWWAMALVITAAAPMAVCFVLPGGATGDGRLTGGQVISHWARYGLLAAGFAIGAGPWIAGVLSNPAAYLGDLLGVRFGQTVAASVGRLGVPGRIVSLVGFNLPALFGMRPPWALSWIAPVAGVFVASLYLLILWQSARRLRGALLDSRVMAGTLLGGWLILILAFVLSPFGVDPTGRYLLPLYPLLAILTGDWAARLMAHLAGWRRWAAPGIVSALALFNLWGTLKAVIDTPPGLTTQFNPVTDIPNAYDGALISFLDSIHSDRGYADYWVTFRLAFLTRERIILAPRLPYKADMSYTDHDNRYPPYSAAADAAPNPVYVVSNLPELDAALAARLDALGVRYAVQRIGPHTVYYGLSRRVTPEELGPFGASSGGDPGD